MPNSTQMLDRFINGGTIRIDSDSVTATVILVQKMVARANIKALGHNVPVAHIKQEIVTVHAMGVEQLPTAWQDWINRQSEVEKAHIEANEHQHLIHDHVTLHYDASQQELILQGGKYQ